MKIVFDTNIIISGFLTVTGLSEYVFTLGLKRHEVVLSEYILEELRRKLTGKLQIPEAQVEELLNFLRNRTTIVKAAANPHIHFKDKKDIPILSLVEACRPHYFITGDKDLLLLKKLGHTLFLSPREALEAL